MGVAHLAQRGVALPLDVVSTAEKLSLLRVPESRLDLLNQDSLIKRDEVGKDACG